MLVLASLHAFMPMRLWRAAKRPCGVQLWQIPLRSSHVCELPPTPLTSDSVLRRRKGPNQAFLDMNWKCVESKTCTD